jgi:predicted SAM-dependent methyltransferase
MKLLRQTIEFTTLTLGKLKRKQRCTVDNGYPIKINLGCGLAVAPGWVNIDGSLNALVANLPALIHRLAYRMTGANRYYTEEVYCDLLRSNRFIHHDLAAGIPLYDAVADYTYSSHFLEHLFRRDAEQLLAEMYRVLKPGGIARISIPDLEFAISQYVAGEKEKMLTHYFFVDDEDNHYSRHKYMYDFSMIEELLLRAGFREVRRHSFAQGQVPDINILDNRPEDSLFVEATK